MSEHGHVVLKRSGSSVAEGTWDGRHLDQLFALAARLLHVKATPTSPGPTVLTLQVFAARDRAKADAFAATLKPTAEDPGFYTAGGYPALHALAHVVEERDSDGVPIFRVLVGTFLDHASAQKAHADLGTKGFIRAL